MSCFLNGNRVVGVVNKFVSLMLPWGSRWGGCRWGWSWWVELASDLVPGRLRPIVDGCLSWQEVPWRYSSRYSRSPLILSLPSPWFPSVFHHVRQWIRHQDGGGQKDPFLRNHRSGCRCLGHQTCECFLGWSLSTQDGSRRHRFVDGGTADGLR